MRAVLLHVRPVRFLGRPDRDMGVWWQEQKRRVQASRTVRPWTMDQPTIVHVDYDTLFQFQLVPWAREETIANGQTEWMPVTDGRE